MNRWLRTLLVAGTLASLGVLWLTSLPLGIAGEWMWDRIPAEPDLLLNLMGGGVAAALYAAVVSVGWKRLSERGRESFSGRDVDGSLSHVALSRPEKDSRPPRNDLARRVEISAWLAALVVIGFSWLWIAQEIAPIQNRLGKAPFVLYYPSSSGYFTKARDEAPNAAAFLADYEDLMRKRDVLHVGTHPPGLFLVFHGLIAACDFSPTLASFLDATQPASFRGACDEIAKNSLRAATPRPLMPLDRRVLWLATLLVLLGGSLTVIPLYGVVRRTHGLATTWLTASLWPTVPAVAVFVPKSDVVYAFVGLMIVWTWLAARDRRSIWLALLAGLFAWCGLMMSLAFLPVGLFAVLVSWRYRLVPGTSVDESGSPALLSRPPQTESGGTPTPRCVLAALAGFVVPTLLLGWFARVNLLTVWWLNYQNHAGFYQHYPRTYWRWLLINPVELGFAAGWPIVLLAAVSVWRLCRAGRTPLRDVAWSMLFVWGSLWLTGKNSGEAARLWILFLPWLVWLAGPLLAEWEAETKSRWWRPVWIILAMQLLVCLLTVSRVSGFHFETG